MTYNPRTPNGASFPAGVHPAAPSNRCVKSASHLADTLSGLNGPSEGEKFANAAVIRNLALIRKQAYGIYLLACDRREGLNSAEMSKFDPTTKEGQVLDSLADAFDKYTLQLDDWVRTIFKPHLRAAADLDRLLGKDSSGLAEDVNTLSLIAGSILEADNQFTTRWTEILEHRADGLKAYPTVLKNHWKGDDWSVIPDFSEERMDERTIFHSEHLMKELGRNWARKDMAKHPADGSTNNRVASTLRSVEDDLMGVIASLTLPLTKDGLREVGLPTNSITAWTDIKRDLQVDSRSLPLRVCCFGSVKHGKSSFINALIGQIVLEPGKTSTTSWPILVKHVSGCKEPILTVDQNHFAPYLEFIREAKFAQRYDENKYLYEVIAESDLRNLRFFENPENTNVFQNCTGRREVSNMIININRLMRLCWMFTTGATFPPLNNTVFPRIDIEFESLEDSFKDRKNLDFAILDLPGLNEEGTTMPEHIMDQALRVQVHGCIFTCHSDVSSQNGTVAAVDKAMTLTKEPVVAAYGTHAETCNGRTIVKKKISKDVWRSSDLVGPIARVDLGGPGLYVSAKEALSTSFDSDMKLKNLHTLWKDTICHTAVLKMTKVPYEDEDLDEDEAEENRITATDNFNDFNTESWRKELNKHVAASRQKELNPHFHKYVVEDSLDRRQFHVLRQARNKLQQLLAMQGDLICRALDRLRGEKNTLDNNLEFQKQAIQIVKEWVPAGNSLFKAIKESIKTEVEAVKQQALTKLEQKITMMRMVDGPFFGSREEAMTLINEIRDQVKATLRSLVSDFVSGIRTTANNVWEGRMLILSNMLTQINVTKPFLQIEIIEALNADAIDFPQAIREDTMRRIARMARSMLGPGETEAAEASLEERAGEAWDNGVAMTWIPHRRATLAKTEDIVIDEDELPEEIEEVVNTVNEFGFLFRAPVSGDVESTDEANLALTHAGFPGQLSIKGIRYHMTNSLIDPWFRVLEAESAASLKGAVRKGTLIARKKVETMLSDRINELSIRQTEAAQLEIDMDVINNLVVARAQCAVIFGAVDELYNQWIAQLSVILAESLLPPSQKPIKAKIKFAPVPI